MKQFHHGIFAFSIMLFITLAGCASTGSGQPVRTVEEQLLQQGLRQGKAVRQAPSFGISGWSYLGPRHVLIDSAPGTQYLLTTRTDCEELAFASQLGYTTTAGSLTRFDLLKTRNSAGMPVSCNIEAIHEVDKAE